MQRPLACTNGKKIAVYVLVLIVPIKYNMIWLKRSILSPIPFPIILVTVSKVKKNSGSKL